MAASYHNHTRWSDGRGTVAEMVAAAAALGLEEIGISDHWAPDPQCRTRRYAMGPQQLSAYVAEVRAVGEGAGLPVRLGIEVDWFPESAVEIAAELGRHAFDYRIGSVHELNGFRYDASYEDWDGLPVVARDEMHRRYWRALVGLAGSGLFDVVAHLDLPKKFAQYPSVDIGDERSAALDAIAAADMVVELNTSGWFKPCEEQYPSEDLLRACRARDILVLLSADAHRPEHLEREFARGATLLREVGYEEIVHFEGRERRSVAL